MKVRFLIIMTFSMVGSISAMNEKDLKKIARRERAQQQPVRKQQRNDIIWVKVKVQGNDNQTFTKGVPLWQLQQMRKLQVMLEDQEGSNSKSNPINAPMITIQQLLLMQKALQATTDLTKFTVFCNRLTPNEKKELINTSFNLEAQGLASLIVSNVFSSEIQDKIGASIQVEGVASFVVDYLTDINYMETSHLGQLLQVACNPNGRFIVSSADGVRNNLILRDTVAHKEIKLLDGNNFPDAYSLVYSPNGAYIAAGSGAYDDNVILFDGNTGKILLIIYEFQHCAITNIAFSPDSNCLIIACDGVGKYPIVCDIKKKRIVHTFLPERGDQDKQSGQVAWSSRGDICVKYVGNTQYSLCIYDGKTYALKKRFVFDIPVRPEGYGYIMTFVDFSPDGKWILDVPVDKSGPDNEIAPDTQFKMVCIRDVETGKTAHCLQADGIVNAVFCDPTSTYIVAVQFADQSLAVWNMATGKRVNCFGQYHEPAASGLFNFDGNYIICAGDGTLDCLKFIDPSTLDYIARDLTIAQARLLYRLCLARMNDETVVLNSKEFEYQIYLTLREDAQKVVKRFLPFKLSNAL
jgi:WD40 repeat protein